MKKKKTSAIITKRIYVQETLQIFFDTSLIQPVITIVVSSPHVSMCAVNPEQKCLTVSTFILTGFNFNSHSGTEWRFHHSSGYVCICLWG